MLRTLVVCSVVALVIGSMTAGCRDAGGGADGGPARAWNKLGKAILANDGPAALTAMTRKCANFQLGDALELVWVTKFDAVVPTDTATPGMDADGKKREWLALCAKYGIPTLPAYNDADIDAELKYEFTLKDAMPRVRDTDRGALFSELLAAVKDTWLTKYRHSETTLGEVDYEDDTATATLSWPSGKRTLGIRFKQIDGTWFVDGIDSVVSVASD